MSENAAANISGIVDDVAKFAQLYALLDSIRETSRRAEQIAGMILEQRDLEIVESIGASSNRAIGKVLHAQRRMMHRHDITK